MLKLVVTISLFISALTAEHPKDVTGKWVVEHVEVRDMGNGISPQQKQQMIGMAKTWFKNATFTLQPDHKCVININIPSMPKINYWRYDANKGIITLSTNSRDKSRIMAIEVTEQREGTFFSMDDTEVTLKVHKAI